ncbi:helix-turn-helix domain-containing protein [Streptomyces sp. NPDC056987]|uniref:helix-turn-helix domain-containing protein n=1 Tax=Streptomyces sp. NPDC056987 TaxID=3345988 RepID=UPI0036308921
MPISPSSSAQAARKNVARRLRDLRRDAGLTGTELASACGWHHAKTSRIENARTPPSPTDIRLWCRACSAEDQAEDLIAASLHAESLYTEWRRRARTGLRQIQESAVPLYRSTKVFRVYARALMPGVLQTEGYARALLGTNARLLDVPDDGAEAAAARVKRSQIIHEAGHRFVLLVEEHVLRFRLGDSDTMAAQLGHLLGAGALPSVSLGVIPMSTAQRPLWVQEPFSAFDDTLVAVELLSARVNITQPSEIALYLKAFEELQALAVYGAQARALIVRAIEALDRDDR